ncbi:GIY COI i14 grp IB protein-like protein [Tirmania nivea]|nr:GIY COI i14 grp IB protein-like protein [Tirmania nivea]
MFTLGGLIIHLALPLYFETTICWEILTIMLLEFYLISVTKYDFEQSAGNQRIVSNKINVQAVGSGYKTLGSSETKLITRSYSNFSNKPGNQDNTQNLKAEKVYVSLKEDRFKILKEQIGRSGVYCLINKVNGHAYVGSSTNLASRMRNYLNKVFLKTLLKYDQSNFTLLILEYVGYEFLTARETFYITYIIPYYNVLKQGYSSLGYKHTEETKKLLSELAKTRAVTGENNPFYNKSHSIESKLRMIEANSAYPVYIYNSFKELLVIFPSVKTLANLIKSNHSTLVNIIKEQTIFRGE